MLNIIRSQIYIMKRDIYYLWATALTLMYFSAVAIEAFESYLSGEALSGSLIAVFMTSEMTTVFFLFAVLFSSRVAGWDFTDKTLNYEVIYGHKRSSIYLGRAIVGIFSGLSRSAFVVLIAVVLPTVVFGWGWSVPAGEMILRYALITLELVRLMAFVIMMSFVARSNVGGAFAGFTAVILPLIVTGLTGMETEDRHSFSWLFSSLSISDVSSFENYTSGYVLGSDITVFTDRIEPQTAMLMSVTAVVFTAVYLLIGYAVFRKSDIH